MDAFAAESTLLGTSLQWARSNTRSLIVGIAIALTGAVVGAGLTAASQKRSATVGRLASLTIETAPGGLEVNIDGTNRGRTPLTLVLPPRSYDISVGSGGDRRTIKAALAPGATMVQRLESARNVASAQHGTLRIESDLAPVAITVDGIDRGVSPLTLQNVTPGEHDVTLGRGRESTRRSVTVRSGETVSLLLTEAGSARPSVAAGWLTVAAPVALQIREDGKLLGSNDSARLLIAAGTHTLDFVNSELGFSQRKTVNVASGNVTALRVDVPNGALSLNAQPWAEVWVDGARVGETPIGNLVRPIGRHEVVFRHPDLGERRETVLVTTLQPARLGVDLRRKSQ